MKRSTLFKRLGGALLILGIVAAAFFVMPPLARIFEHSFDNMSRDALAAVGGHATPDQAGAFMLSVFAALFLVTARRGAK